MNYCYQPELKKLTVNLQMRISDRLKSEVRLKLSDIRLIVTFRLFYILRFPLQKLGLFFLLYIYCGSRSIRCVYCLV